MQKILLKLLTVLLCLGTCFFITASVLYWAGGRINSSASLPIGLYWVVDKPIAKHDLVTFFLDESWADYAKRRRYTGLGWRGGYLIKQVAAVAGDVIDINKNGVWVNGQHLQNSLPREVDKSARPLPALILRDYKLKEDEFLLMSTYSAASFDSRYFGLIKAAQIANVVIAMFTFGEN
jgi:conjugative transfer signal peptidase TraF